MKNLLYFIVFTYFTLHSQDITTGLVAYYPFSGNTLDSTSNNLHSVNHGATLTYDYCGNPNSAYRFDGIDDWMDCGNSDLFDSQNLTVCAWIKPEEGVLDKGYVALKWKTESDKSGSWSFNHKTLNVTKNGSSSNSARNIPQLDYDEWYFITGVYDYSQNMIHYYLNCELIDSEVGQGGIHVNNSEVLIGAAKYFIEGFFKGTIDEVRIYNRPLTQEEICYIYHMYDIDLEISGDNYICDNSLAEIQIDNYNPENYYEWSTGETSRTISVNKPGTYYVNAENIYGCSMTDSITILPGYDAESAITGDTVICEGDIAELRLNKSQLSYDWSTGDSTRGIFIDSGGIYSVSFVNQYGCIQADSFYVEEIPYEDINIIEDGVLCRQGDTVVLSVDNYLIEHRWSTGQTSDSIIVNEAGMYYVDVINEFGCVTSDTVFVEYDIVDNFEIVQIGDFCIDDEVTLFVDNNYEEYVWSTGESSDSITVDSAGTYYVTVTNANGCTLTKEITVEVPDYLEILVTGDDFPAICSFEQLMEELKIINPNANTDAIISDIYLKSGISFSMDSLSLPVEVPAMSSLSEKIIFSPVKDGNFYDTLVVVIDFPCPATIEFPLSGIGKPVESKIWLGDTLAHPQYDFCIPVYGYLNCDFKDGAYVDYELEFSLDYRIYRDIYVREGGIIDEWTEGFMKHYVVSDSNVFMNSETRIINYICGVLMASSVNETDITIDSVNWGDYDIPTTKEDGSIKVDICDLEFRMLSYLRVSNIQLRPNPAGDYVTCYIEYPSEKKSKIVFYNLEGLPVKTIEIPPQHNIRLFEYDIDLSDIPSGIYIVKYICNIKILEKKLIIAK